MFLLGRRMSDVCASFLFAVPALISALIARVFLSLSHRHRTTLPWPYSAISVVKEIYRMFSYCLVCGAATTPLQKPRGIRNVGLLGRKI